MNKAFVISRGKGFRITFANGWAVSVQFGPANYCDHYNRKIGSDEEKCGAEGSQTAECAVINPEGDLVRLPEFGGDSVSSHSTPEEVAALVAYAAAQTPVSSVGSEVPND